MVGSATTTLLGADATVSVWIVPRLRVEGRFGARSSVSQSGPDGAVSTTTLGGKLGLVATLTQPAGRAGLDVGVFVGAMLASFAATARTGATATAASDVAVLADASLTGWLRLGSSVRLVASAGPVVALRPVRVTDGGATIGGIDGAGVATSVGLWGTFCWDAGCCWCWRRRRVTPYRSRSSSLTTRALFPSTPGPTSWPPMRAMRARRAARTAASVRPRHSAAPASALWTRRCASRASRRPVVCPSEPHARTRARAARSGACPRTEPAERARPPCAHRLVAAAFRTRIAAATPAWGASAESRRDPRVCRPGRRAWATRSAAAVCAMLRTTARSCRPVASTARSARASMTAARASAWVEDAHRPRAARRTTGNLATRSRGTCA